MDSKKPVNKIRLARQILDRILEEKLELLCHHGGIVAMMLLSEIDYKKTKVMFIDYKKC